MAETHPYWANLRPRQHKLTPEDAVQIRQDIVTRYKQGHSVRDVATYVNRGKRFVCDTLEEAGIPRRPVGRPRKSKSNPLIEAPVPRSERLNLARAEEILSRPIRTPNKEK